MKTLLIVLAVVFAGCAEIDTPRYECVQMEYGVVLGVNHYEDLGWSACMNGADTATVQFSDGQILTICATAERGDQVKVCRAKRRVN